VDLAMRSRSCAIIGLACFLWLPVRADTRIDTAVKLVMRKAPSVKDIVSQGKRVRFQDLGYVSECVVKLKAYEDFPDHIATINFYDVNICNNSINAQF
jgi:hypothetical protein